MPVSPTIHTLYMGHDNEQALELRVGGANLTLAQYDEITRVRIDLRAQAGGSTYALDSDTTPALFRHGGAEGRRLVIDGGQLEDVPDLIPGTYRARVIAYHPAYPGGIVYADYPEYLIVIHPGGEPA